MTSKSALLVIDIQHDFLPGGSLAVNDGNKIIPGVLDLINTDKYNWDAVVFSQDWHPKDHISFASNHENIKPFEEIEFTSTKDSSIKLKQTVWPNHCIQHCHGANFPDELTTAYRNIHSPKTIIQKGTLHDRDYYSAFNDVWDDDQTGLSDFLKENKITDIYLVGLAYDYCVKFSAESSAKLGFNTTVIKSLSKPIHSDKINETDKFYKQNNVEIIDENDDKLKALLK
ncbi:Nicotinamidase [Wickerhamomyces ciferrii]|uniref:nicotinamidase n=1 Tax=Wickerhamomyces ciferrii (strain ATCC 14091 / BCRC 22168 / CBS 111 / JCM 3599 / NBRC 0793 / NRRL Y-1031 F-60-10) TaxID=1206466 RepID=K0KX98_WICCF|nr:Nicotinamidase [Wickerhamomyces ciferrii]CCH45703.1 Nicotinamidase [Wickerhamomyces ciferrii]